MRKEQLIQYKDLLIEVEELDQRLNEVKVKSRLYQILSERKKRAESLISSIENFIIRIPDNLTKEVFILKYIENMPWLMIARRMGKADESYPRKMIHDKYLKNVVDI